ncbi:hypothetical protein FDP41_000954 [Naegleria fowleri]|uniref:Uncharacterized protein n=1 Tax=Naegleria fowleri TaxID=5763 RepID=A0A6A5BZ33_NAEFO|nr:uncharacterized protein FDP41_000954 [Naegleria fowleri]KAF0979801.1 hypothetical protein FDP41_000954 [Naegleria fowleri]
MMLKSIKKDKPADKFVDEVFSEFKVENVEKYVSKSSDIKENLEKKGVKLTPAIMSLALCAGPDGFMRFYEKSKTFKIWSALLDQNSPINSLRIVHIGERAMTTLYNTREEVAQEYNELLAKHYQSLLMEHKDEGKPKTKSSKKKQCLRNPPLLNHPTTASVENAAKLNLDAEEIEINFIKKHKENGNVEIYEATISSFSNDEKLLTKMLQLERQIMFYKECFKNTVISRVGLVSPSNSNLERVEKIIEQHNGLFVNIQLFIENNTFSVVKEGHKPEID